MPESILQVFTDVCQVIIAFPDMFVKSIWSWNSRVNCRFRLYAANRFAETQIFTDESIISRKRDNASRSRDAPSIGADTSEAALSLLSSRKRAGHCTRSRFRHALSYDAA